MGTYTNAAGEVKTTCGGHRTVGYYFDGPHLRCRACSQPDHMHESFDETIERNRDATI